MNQQQLPDEFNKVQITKETYNNIKQSSIARARNYFQQETKIKATATKREMEKVAVVVKAI